MGSANQGCSAGKGHGILDLHVTSHFLGRLEFCASESLSGLVFFLGYCA